MPERPTDFIDYDDDETQPAPRSEAIDFDEEEDSPPLREPGPADDEEDAGNLRDGIGRAAAVLKYIVEQIVDEPDEIQIGASSDDRGPVLLLRVAEDDRGKVIGRQGRIVQAIRTIVKAASVGSGEKVNVEILD
ncbi:MAG TPA: KH domain-containing protein [Candidatus Eremiobacteraceae bacterium]|nr:KH domain-containing protein [Candidatus Eremiobacteraceae bacterium]